MSNAFKICVVLASAALGMGDRAVAQCFVCSDGNQNTAAGSYALANYPTGVSNTASGYRALYANSTGANNTALGSNSLYSNSTGKGNDALGANALFSNTTGIRNLGIGSNALLSNVSGSYNIGIGFDAGSNQNTGTDNIYIANTGVAGESQTLRLGTQGSSGVVGSGILTAYIAGVATSQVTGSAVYVTASGQLGVLASSERYKTAITSMGSSTSKLDELRPVSFHLKSDPHGAVQYGLIAEEVEKVYPELVIRDAAGAIQGVRYDELAPMLLNEVQEQRRALNSEAEQRRVMQEQLTELRRLNQSMQAAIARLQTANAVAATTR
jgi:hypothetical protein